jgi:hypothetical protein
VSVEEVKQKTEASFAVGASLKQHAA